MPLPAWSGIPRSRSWRARVRQPRYAGVGVCRRSRLLVSDQMLLPDGIRKRLRDSTSRSRERKPALRGRIIEARSDPTHRLPNTQLAAQPGEIPCGISTPAVWNIGLARNVWHRCASNILGGCSPIVWRVRIGSETRMVNAPPAYPETFSQCHPFLGGVRFKVSDR